MQKNIPVKKKFNKISGLWSCGQSNTDKEDVELGYK